MSKIKTKYPNVYYDEQRQKYEYRKMINGSLLFGRADTPEEALRDLIDAESRNTLDEKKSKKVSLPDLDTILDSYLKDRKNNLKITTYYRQKNIIELYFKNHFRKISVDKLIDNDFKKWYSFIKNKDIVYKSKNQYLAMLKSIFEYIHINYGYDCLYVKRLNHFKDYSIKNPIQQFKIFSYDDFKKLYPGLNDYQKLLLLTLFLFGLRSGELLGLTPKAFLLKDNILSIYQAVTWKTEKKGYILVSPKSKTSNRTYPLPNFYKSMIIHHIKENKLKEKDFIFFSPNSNKNPLSSTSLQRIMEKWSEILGYHLHPHLFRHSAISQLYASGLNIESIKKIMGHSSSSITKEVYLHDTEETSKALNDYLENMFKL